MKKISLCTVIILVMLLPIWGQEDKAQRNAGLATLLNLVPGFGLGSFMQGDACGGITQLAAAALGAGCTLAALGSLFNPYISGTTSEIMFYAGIGTYLFSIGWGIFRPTYYSQKNETRLENNTVTWRISPDITPCTGRQGVNVGLELAVRYPLD